MTGAVPIALSADIVPNMSAGVRVMGAEYVVWRDTHGTAHIWDDRCPHRGMKMSLGFVRGDGIACLYHGWEYGADGRCRKIPAHPELPVPASIRIGTHPAAERSGIIWLGLDDNPLWPDDFAGWSALRSVAVQSPAELVREALGLREPVSPLGSLGLALQPVTERLSMLHMLLADGADALEGYRECLRLRSRLERLARERA